ncbi:MAG: acyl-CoA/acyl-ACP dehydrogenase, partial [Pirellulaceae bacterium]|nr:acyl-CoA/acyl-ACP dehydrogenase [Pirellulaceae bacterium]
GVFRWFLPKENGGFGWTPREIATGYLELGAACLTTTFVITQWVAAVKRLLASDYEAFNSVRQQLLEACLRGESHVTVGISHLTTSRRHLERPVLRASAEAQGYRLDGLSPWVTAATFADYMLIGATMDNGEQVLLLVSTRLPGVTVEPPQALVALSASCTTSVQFENVFVPHSHLVAGPRPDVLKTSRSTGTGGIQTSSLALALAQAAIAFLQQQTGQRPELQEKADQLDQQWQVACEQLMQMADGDPVCSNEDLRTDANSLVLRSTQAALVAAKGAGFVEGHPVGRWCREAMFFLVWSCPQSVQDANLCELVGISN